MRYTCTRHPGVILRSSDDLDRHDALHYLEDQRELERENLSNLAAIFASHGYVETDPGIYVRKEVAS